MNGSDKQRPKWSRVEGRLVHYLTAGPLALATIGVSILMLLADTPYLVVQGSYALRDIFGARPFDRVPNPSESEELLFSRARDIRSFGIGELGLADTDSYTRYRRIEREALVWVVSGVRQTAWERHLWRYPFVGALPYRGYYRPEAARREAERLKAGGYDTIVRPVTAYSFLGVVPDPLYSFAVGRPHSSLADLILHEMAHATLFVSGSGAFNENFATFVGQEGSRRYIVRTYGAGSPEYEQMLARRKDRDAARRLLMGLHERLVVLFEEKGRVDLLAAKEEIYREFQSDLQANYQRYFQTDGYRWLAERELNNAVVDLFMTYSGEVDLFYRLLDARGGSLEAVLEELKSRRREIRRKGLDAVRRLAEVSAFDGGGSDG
ncbi:MAG: aminopeptidase [Spirochaetaceae bacterium]